MPSEHEKKRFYRPGGPIIDEHEYFRAISLAQEIWFWVLVILWVFNVNFQITRDLLSTISSSSIELAALTLGVLGVLHEFNKRDVFFKLGLLLVAFFFAATSFSGFITTMTWISEFDSPQVISVWLVVFLFGGYLIRSLSIRLRKNFTLTIDNGIAFGLPTIFLLFGLFGANRLSSIIALFIGAMILLLCLMAVTSYMVYRRSRDLSRIDQEEERKHAEDEQLEKLTTELRETETQKEKVLEALVLLKLIEMCAERRKSSSLVHLISKNDLVAKLRIDQNGISEHSLQNTISNMIQSEKIFAVHHFGPFWLPLTNEQTENARGSLRTFAYVVTERAYAKSKYALFGLTLEKLRNRIALESRLPVEIIEKYVIPYVDMDYEQIESGNLIALVHRAFDFPVEVDKTAPLNNSDMPRLQGIFEIDDSTRIKEHPDLADKILRVLNLQLGFGYTQQKDP